MAFDDRLAARVRAVLGDAPYDEKKMFGGLCFMVAGHMCCGILGDELMVRVGPDELERSLARKHARVMDFTGRPSKNMVYVAADGVRTKRQLASWIDKGIAFVQTLPSRS